LAPMSSSTRPMACDSSWCVCERHRPNRHSTHLSLRRFTLRTSPRRAGRNSLPMSLLRTGASQLEESSTRRSRKRNNTRLFSMSNRNSSLSKVAMPTWASPSLTTPHPTKHIPTGPRQRRQTLT
jgi:hypothetical protein